MCAHAYVSEWMNQYIYILHTKIHKQQCQFTVSGTHRCSCKLKVCQKGGGGGKEKTITTHKTLLENPNADTKAYIVTTHAIQCMCGGNIIICVCVHAYALSTSAPLRCFDMIQNCLDPTVCYSYALTWCRLAMAVCHCLLLRCLDTSRCMLCAAVFPALHDGSGSAAQPGTAGSQRPGQTAAGKMWVLQSAHKCL